jgi:hypothetical protein
MNTAAQRWLQTHTTELTKGIFSMIEAFHKTPPKVRSSIDEPASQVSIHFASISNASTSDKVRGGLLEKF